MKINQIRVQTVNKNLKATLKAEARRLFKRILGFKLRVERISSASAKDQVSSINQEMIEKPSLTMFSAGIHQASPAAAE